MSQVVPIPSTLMTMRR